MLCFLFSFSGGGGNNGGGGFTYPAMPIPPGYPYPPGAAAYTPPPAPMNSGPPPPGQLINSRGFQTSWQVNFTKWTLAKGPSLYYVRVFEPFVNFFVLQN